MKGKVGRRSHIAEPGQLDTTHGAILYLENVTVSFDGFKALDAINLYLDAGVPEEKLILGAPAYTRAWSGVADGGDNGYSESASGAAPGTFEYRGHFIAPYIQLRARRTKQPVAADALWVPEKV